MRASGTALALLLTGTAIALSGCHRVAAPVPLDRLNAQQTHGHAVFMARCSACHYDRTNEPLHGPSLLSLYKKPYLPSGAPANDDRLTATILHGRNLMPAVPALNPAYSPGDLDDLIAYLHTL